MGRRSKRELFVQYWLPVLLYVCLIFALSSQSNLKPPLDFAYSDKLAHALEYAILGLLLARAVRAAAMLEWPLTAALLALSLGMIVGVADELFQSAIPGRDSSAFDFMADAVGLALGQLVYVALARD